MMIQNKILKPALLISALGLSTISFANDGFYIGAHVQNSTLNHTIQRDTGEAANPSITSFAEESDGAIGLNAGYKFHVNENAFLAVEGFYTDENAETTNINNMLQTIIGLQSSYGINLKAGFDITDEFSVYGIVGMTILDFDIDNSYPFAPPMRSGSEEEADLSIGFGAEYRLNMHWAVKAEYTYMNDVAFTPLPEVAVPGKINPNELNYSNLKLGISYSF